MAKYFKRSKDELKEIFDNAGYCDCGTQDCESNHRLCPICNEKIQFGEYLGFHDGNENSDYAWNVDHITPISRGGSEYLYNLRPTHPWCNRDKADR